MTGLDFESTDKDPETAHIVSGAVSTIRPGEPPVTFHQMCDPGIEIPAEAAAIHGITTERARAEGGDRRRLIETITELLALSISAGVPIVGMNLSYDLTLLDRERRRLDLSPLEDAIGLNELGPVVDIYVIDKYVNQYRPGSRKLAALSEHYGVTLDGAHDASHDTLAACRVAYKMMRRAHGNRRALWSIYSKQVDKEGNKIKGWQVGKILDRFVELSKMDVWQLHWAQARWRAEQSASLEEYLRRTDDEARVDPWWPIRPFDAAGAPEPSGQLAMEVSG